MLFLLVCALFNFFLAGEQQFSYLANSFLHGKFDFLEVPMTTNDTVPFAGNYYWPLQPFPAVVLIVPVFLFSLFGKLFLQGYLQFFLVVGVFYLIFRICKKLNYSSNDSLFLSFAFCFCSFFLGVAFWPWSWYFSQVVSTFLLFWGLYEFMSRKRYLLLGIIAGLIFLTRAPASLVILLFVSDLFWISRANSQLKLRNFFKLFIPFFIAILVSFLYNYLRFKNIFEFGYNLQIIGNPTLKAREYGTFNPIHLPGNLYFFLLNPPTPVYRDSLSSVLSPPYIRANPWGMGIFFSSPYFLLLFFLKYKEKLLKLMWATVLVIAVPIFFYYGIGYRQYGFRYSLDFLPILFLIFLFAYKKKYSEVSKPLKFAILAFAYINLYLFFTFLSDFN